MKRIPLFRSSHDERVNQRILRRRPKMRGETIYIAMKLKTVSEAISQAERSRKMEEK